MKLVLLGPPGAGKGTQAVRLAERFGVPHISTGDILRRQVAAKTELGKKAATYVRGGKLVPDALVIEMVRKRLGEKDARKGFILDGFPRTREQAEALDKMANVDHALLLFLDPEDLIKRSTGRWVCENCESVYHVITNPPKKPGFCDRCGGRLNQREDDKEKGILTQVYGSGLIDEVFERAIEALTAAKH